MLHLQVCSFILIVVKLQVCSENLSETISLNQILHFRNGLVTCISCMSLPTFWADDSLIFSSLDWSKSFRFMSTSWASSSWSLFLLCSLSLDGVSERQEKKRGGGVGIKCRLFKQHMNYMILLRLHLISNVATGTAKSKIIQIFILGLVGVFFCWLKS